MTDLKTIVDKISENEDDDNNIILNALAELQRTVQSRFDNLINVIYPVGSIYTSVNNISPETFIGGKWEKIKDRFLLCSGDSYTTGSVGGEASHTLTQAETPTHTHTRGSMNITGTWYAEGMMRDIASPVSTGALYTHTFSAIAKFADGGMSYPLSKGIGLDASRSWTGETSSVGGGSAHNNMPPYLVVNVWKRIE